jgi:hypothetical protein
MSEISVINDSPHSSVGFITYFTVITHLPITNLQKTTNFSAFVINIFHYLCARKY